MRKLPWSGMLLMLTILLGCRGDKEMPWQPLFNGVDLTGWVPKITGHPVGVDPYGTFSAEEGSLVVRYAQYDSFANRFGHLFYEQPFDHFHLRLEYRFVGEQLMGGPDWAWRNSGVMFYSQAPETMTDGQDFPISLEAQFLGGDGATSRPTMNLCTPGTHVMIDERVVTDHCVTSSSRTFHGDQWVSAEIIATPDKIIHVAGGDTVLHYRHPTVGGGVVSGYDPTHKQDGTVLTGGYIALQSESHPIEFRRIEVRRLAKD